jgi:hypothetical protein
VSADLLRRAAEKLREAVDPDYVFVAPWTAVKEVESLDGWTVRDPEGPIAEGLPGPEAAYFALVHPPVALALADWLNQTADRIDALSGAYAPEAFDAYIAKAYAVPNTLARAVLRESTGDAPGEVGRG